MKEPAITVFMAVYNGSSYIAEAIESVLTQTFGDFELLIINDGSTDNSKEIINRYQDKRIRLIENKTNQGLRNTRHRGLMEARGKLFAILDSDDVAFPNRLEIQYEYMAQNPEIALCGSKAIFINSSNTPIGSSISYSGNKNVLMLFENALINSSIIIRTDIARVVGYGDYEYSEDYDLALRIAEKHKIEILEIPLVKYRYHEDNISLRRMDLMRESEKAIIKDMHERLGIKTTARLINIHHSYFSGKDDEFLVSDFYNLFMEIKRANEKLNVYHNEELQKLLFKKWYEVILKKGGKRAFPMLFKKGIFTPSYVTFKQIRRTFKRSVKSFFFS